VIGIYGPWGDGKTSVLNLITQELLIETNVVAIRFNPWRFTDESQLLRSFFVMLAEKLDKSLETKGEKVGKFLKQYAGVLAPVGFGAKEVVEGLARPEADLDELKSRVEEALREAGKRLVIMMDDIDRLDKQEIQTIFKLVKLSADFPFVSYVLAFDDEMVAAALAEKYGNVEAGKKFLEKIVQVPLHLPPARSEVLGNLCFEGINAALELAEIKVSQSEVQRFVGVFIRAFERRMKTPRQVKQYATAISFGCGSF
jgi:predicted KAP-like P-loop ATPase